MSDIIASEAGIYQLTDKKYTHTVFKWLQLVPIASSFATYQACYHLQPTCPC